MSKKALLPILLLAAGGIFFGASAGKEITVAAGQSRDAAINAFQTRLAISGRVDESVFLLGGSLRLDGEVTGDVICVAADVEIAATATIGRDLIVIGGSLRQAEGRRIAGRVYDIRSQRDMKQVAASLLPFFPASGGLTFFKVIITFFWLILTLLALVVFPAPIAQASALLPRQPWRHLGRGLMALLIFLLLLIVFLLLSFVLIGIPLLIVLMAAYFLLLIFGRAVVFYFIGERVCGALRLRANPVFFIVLGLAAYTLLKFIPYAGGVLLFALDLLAIGIGVGFFIRSRKATI